MTLSVGSKAFCLLRSPVGKGSRKSIDGAALVRVVGLPGQRGNMLRSTFEVRVLRASGGLVGRTFEMGRADLFSSADRDERTAFGVLVRRLWGRS